MIKTSWPWPLQNSSRRNTELVTPLTWGRKASVTTAIRRRGWARISFMSQEWRFYTTNSQYSGFGLLNIRWSITWGLTHPDSSAPRPTYLVPHGRFEVVATTIVRWQRAFFADSVMVVNTPRKYPGNPFHLYCWGPIGKFWVSPCEYFPGFIESLSQTILRWTNGSEGHRITGLNCREAECLSIPCESCGKVDRINSSMKLAINNSNFVLIDEYFFKWL